ncbi:MAG: PAS domain S-box protein [Desulfatiglandaceae bacterium]|jgi:PAS domain S-box-containing protein
MPEKMGQRLTAILQAMEDGIYIINSDFVLEFMNKSMIRSFGEGVGEKCYKMINRLDHICPWCRAEEVFRGKTINWEHHVAGLDKIFDLTELPLRHEDGMVSKLTICRDITLRKLSEDKEKASAEDYRRLFEHVGCGVYVSSKEGKFLNANPALLEMLGYDSKEDFLGMDITLDLYLRPEDRSSFQKMIERDGQVIDYEVDFKHKDGTPIPVLMTSHVRYDRKGEVIGYEGLILDQTHRKQMEQQLQEAHDFLNKIIRNSPNAIIGTDMKGNIFIWNPGAEETLGYTAEEVVGKMNIDQIYPEGVAKRAMKMMRGPTYGGVGKLKSFPIVFVRQDREIVEGSISASIIYGPEGREMASVGIFVDLRERLEMEEKLRKTQEQLLQSEKLAAMGRLTSQVAHEVNNPLYGIMNTLELLKTEIPPESKRRKILEMALSETVRLSELLRKMLSFSKPDQEEKQPMDINEALDEILLLYEKQLRENSIRIKTSFDEGLEKVLASKNQLRQVFLNMVSNARDAMPEGGTFSVTTGSRGGQVLIEIADTGTGIDKEHLDKIFDTFFTTKASVKGVGLGLSVCHGFIKDHGGDIRVESEKGSGTTFTITLPISK